MRAQRLIFGLPCIVLIAVSVALAACTSGVQSSGGQTDIPIIDTAEATTDVTETFDSSAPSGWTLSPEAAVEDGVLRLPGGSSASYNTDMADFTLSVRARFASGQGELLIAYRSTDAGTYQAVVGPAYTVLSYSDEPALASGEIPPAEDWFDIGIVAQGDKHTISIDGKQVLEANDAAHLSGRNIAFEGLGEGMVIELDDFRMSAAGGTQPSQSQSEVAGPAAQPHDPNTWVRLGGPPGGLGYDIRYNFANPDTWYATDSYGGVHISTDDGHTWFPSNNGIPGQGGSSGDDLPIFSLTVDPHDPQIIWVGTNVTGHIYKSTDGGANWVEKDAGVTIEHNILSFRGFTVDPRSSDIVYAMGETAIVGGHATVWGLGEGGVVYKTTDGGESWQKIWDGGIPSALARYMWINPQNPDILYVSTGIFDRGAVGEPPDPGTNPYPFGGLGILKSTDGGQTWRVLNEANGLEHLYIGSLYMNPDNPDILLAAAGHMVPEGAIQRFTSEGHSPLGIYRTTDGGETWTQVLEPALERIDEAFTAVELCPSDPNIAYAASGATVYRSEDAGATWTLVSGDNGWGPPGIPAGIPIDLQCDPRDVNRIFANNYNGGNFLSEDGGATWQNASDGYTGAQIMNLAVDPFDAAHVFAAIRGGAWESDDGGATWHGLQNLPSGMRFFGGEVAGAGADPSHPNRIILSSDILLKSTDEGWQTQSIPFMFSAAINAIVFAPSDPSTIYLAGAEHNCILNHACPGEANPAGPANVAVSHDGGQTWLDVSGAQFAGVPVLDLAVDPADANVAYVATVVGLFKTTDGGTSWHSLTDALPGMGCSVAVSPVDSSFILASVCERGFYTSSDGGKTWQQVSAGLQPTGSHYRIVFDPTNSQIVYTTDMTSGVYRSTDGGKTWQQINNGLTSRSATALVISADGQHVYVATNGAGVFRLDVNGVSPIEE
jgi:photosystem II stability/assembly factor-like uncharacterized protein